MGEMDKVDKKAHLRSTKLAPVGEAIFFNILILIGLLGCNDNKESNNKALAEKDTFVFSSENITYRDFDWYWAERDTIVFINGDTITVKFEKNDSLERDIVITKNGVRFEMGYGFPEDCIVNYPAPIPWFEWTNGHVVCLSRSCGSYCTSYIFINCDNKKELERENILCADVNNGIITYLQEGTSKTIVIEKVFAWNKKYLLKYEIPCENAFFCLDTISFDNRELFISYKNSQDKIIYEKFKF